MPNKFDEFLLFLREADQIAKSLPAVLVDSPDTFDPELTILELEQLIRTEANIIENLVQVQANGRPRSTIKRKI